MAIPSSVSTPRPGWVVFTDDDPSPPGLEPHPDGGGSAVKPRPTEAPYLIHGGRTAVGVSTRQTVWAQFEDRPMTQTVPSQPQVKGTRHSVCSSPSFWSSDPPSESSGTSQSEDHSSLGDLPPLPSQTSSLTHSPNSSTFQDEGIDMESQNWPPAPKHVNGQSESHVARLASWVTFDDDGPIFCRPGGLPQSNHDDSSTSEVDGNPVASPPSVQTRDAIQHLLDLTPEGVRPLFALDGPPLSIGLPSMKNPFLDEGLSHVQPSPINPFVDFFQEQVEAKVTPNNGCYLENTQQSCTSPPVPPSTADIKRESLLPLSTELDTPARGGVLPWPPSERGGQSLWMVESDQQESALLPDDPVEPGELEEPPYQPAHMTPRDGWPMMLRIPEKKNIMSSRHWGPIFVKVSDAGRLQLFYEKGLEKPFKEFQLDGRHELSEHKLQSYNESDRVHTISIDHVTYKEKRKIQSKVTVVHAPAKDQLVKLGTVNYSDFLSFTHALRDVLMLLPVEQESPSSSPSYQEEEVFVDVRDEFHGVVSKADGRIVQQLVMTHIYVLAFASGSPACKIGLNDVQVKGNEVVSLHDIIPNTTTRWVRLRDCRLHSSADKQEFTSTRTISFTPPAGRRFELLRFCSLFAEKSLPFTLRTVASVKGAEVELQSWLAMSTGFSSNRDPLTLIPCENVMIRYPIPQLWAKNFRRESLGGEKSLKARFNKGANFGSTITSGQEPAMRVTLGTAKYEHAFRAVVWRINSLPDKNSALGHPHTFFCRLELGSDWEVPTKFHRHLEVEFDMPAASASRTTVRSLSVGDRTDVKKWVNYKAHFLYQVEMEQRNTPKLDGLHTERPGECSLQ
ncbi:stonin-2 [Brienomyrus brachyistius]|uniref:stonin-2 n=1 Tax=Brienomyrus brachyistius TaxID=42636 RepID=UPI0020B22913|nr:stonin-2 [Brienomyrus brachyistius]XP_048830292.1 stonin-2 [Brienomyrus brachyistius]XP_048830293.1 stonin-2 [Brienomyrus brachyistius]XP_048830294.1 stonin-2 [Brienomyrus brachyistius]XP_048830295.1 stonin-2 [Brienomyrus brachyistius]XP_048830296.1 stonin-2 [Brienomyrus brachyistius]